MSITRRGFLAGAASAGLGFGLGALSHRFPLAPPEVGPDWRPGVETFVPSTCMLCPAHCGIRARLVDGILSRIDGNPLHPVSQGGLCPKGRAGAQLLYHPGRIREPVERIGGAGSDEFRPIGWDEAIGRIVKALQASTGSGQPESVRWLVGECGGIMGDLISGFAGACGGTVTVDDYRDGSSEVMRMCQGIDSPPAFDLISSDLVFSFGAGLSESWSGMSLAARMRDADAGERPQWIQADIRLSRSAAAADEWVPVRPGSYGSLALGLAYLMLREGNYDAETVSRRVSGWEDWTDEDGKIQPGFRKLVLQFGRPDDVSDRTGVPVFRLLKLAKTFGGARRPVAVWDQSVTWRRGGLADAFAIHALNIITGSLNRPGGVLVQGPSPVPSGNTLAGSPLTSATWRDIAGSEGRKSANVVFLYKSNPIASLADGEAVRRVLAKVPLVVSFSPFFDESARCADLILPDHTYLERWQDAPSPSTVAFPAWGVVQPVVKPLHDTRATGDVILEIGSKLGGEAAGWTKWSSMEQAVHERGLRLAAARRGSAFVERTRQGELRELENRGWWLSHTESNEGYWNRILRTGGWFDPFYDYHDRSAMTQRADGRVWIFPQEARVLLAGSDGAAGDRYLQDMAKPPVEESGDDEYPLTLVPFRVMTLASGGTPLMPWLLEHLGVLAGSAWELWVEVNPKTAAQQGIHAGQRVRVESDKGVFNATARLLEGTRPGVVNVPYGLHSAVEGWGSPEGANPLAAIGDGVDPASGLPDWNSGRVRLVPIRGGA